MTHPIPDEALDSDIAIIARKGSGKSYLARGLAERLLDLQRRMVVIDPLGAWWGLRASADGASAGYPVAVFGGEHGDMPLTETMGEPLAKLIAGENLPCVIDTSLMRKEEQGRLAIDLFEGLFRYNKDALTIILEEADVFAPQNPAKDGYAAQVLHEVDRIARRGRARGLRLISLTQRPARLHKDVLSQAATLVAMRLSAPQDRDAIKAWVEGNADRDQSREVIDSLASLAVGEGWVWAADLGILRRAKFPRIKTLDTSATPKAGETRIEPKTLAQVDMSAIREALSQKSASDDEPKRDKPSKSDLSAAEGHGYQRGLAEGIERGKSQGIALGITRAQQALAALRIPEIAAEPVGASPQVETVPTRNVPARPSKPAQRSPAPPRDASSPLSEGERKLLAAVAGPNPVSWSAAAIRAGYAVSGGGFLRARKSLLERGLLSEEAGKVVGGQSDAETPTADELITLWSAKMDGGAGQIVRIIAAAPWSDGMRVVDIAAAANYVATGGGFLRAMKALRNSGIVERRGKDVYRLSAAFIEAAGADGGRRQ